MGCVRLKVDDLLCRFKYKTDLVIVVVFVSGSWDTRLLQPPTTTQVICNVVAKEVVLF